MGLKPKSVIKLLASVSARRTLMVSQKLKVERATPVVSDFLIFRPARAAPVILMEFFTMINRFVLILFRESAPVRKMFEAINAKNAQIDIGIFLAITRTDVKNVVAFG